MKAMFVNEDSYPFAELMGAGFKTAETRSRKMLSALVGERVAIVSTKRSRKPLIIGFVDVTEERFCLMDEVREQTKVAKGSKYDADYKWCYFLKNSVRCNPFPLPSSAIRHGRSWCEF